ncbi:MAG TPA: 5-(carboxyamino)imidazole ribonucleotide synthase, partial [Mycobacteriales bacterium]|nr:5-(carboxyamino)imidazole ribonucleotide synthase [Mycobacteriales bacterium]
QARAAAAEYLASGVPVLVEERVAMRRELSALVARSPFGQGAAWPVVETVQEDGICVTVIAPAPDLPAESAAAAQQLGLRLADELGVVGVLAVELFETTAGELLVNELAMRPHNSGHWSIEGSTTSQFEQHLRAVLDWPLGDTRARAPFTVMANLLGGPTTNLASTLPAALEAVPNCSVHLYGKAARPGRKLGHVTALGDDLEETRDRARRAVAVLRGDA